MSATTTPTTAPDPPSPAASAAAPASAPAASPASALGVLPLDERTGLTLHLRAVRVVCHRELLRLEADRIRIVSSLVQPFLFLFVMGTGLSRLTERSGGLDFRTFLYPGVLAMSVQFTAMFAAMSIVWDREFGFLREMLVAPVPRSAIIVGKALGGAILATAQALVVLALAGFAKVPYDPVMLLLLVGQLFVLSFTICAFGLVAAARVRRVQAFMGILNLLIMPLFFLSGGLYPLSDLPGWLQVAARFNPLTYAVAALRHTVFVRLDLGPATRARFDPGLSWFGWSVPPALAVLVVAALGCGLLYGAVVQIRADD
jgi:ABC-2 type transport system permease protein